MIIVLDLFIRLGFDCCYIIWFGWVDLNVGVWIAGILDMLTLFAGLVTLYFVV